MSFAEHNLLKIAQVLKSNGTDGELIISFRDIDPDDINTEEPVFIYFDGLPVPFYIESFSRRGHNKALTKLTGISDITDAEEVTGQGVYIDRNSIDIEYEDDDFSFLKGWTLQGSDGTKKGTISEYLDIPGNPCLEIKTKKGGMIIPLNEDLIISVDEKSETIVMEIPNGLESIISPPRA